MAYNWDLYTLPLVSLAPGAETVDDVRTMLGNELKVVNGILEIPTGLPGDLRQAILNIQFQLGQGQGFVDAFLRTGHNLSEPASNVEGLKDALALRLTLIAKAKPLWDAWYKDAIAQGTPAAQLPPPPPGGGVNVTGGGSSLLSAGQMELRDYVAIGVVAGLGLILWKAMK